MVCYIDTSALVPLCVKEASSAALFARCGVCPQCKGVEVDDD